MSKKRNTFASLIKENKEAIRKLYYKHIFLMIVVSSLTISVILYKLGAHIVLFGDNENALGEYVKTMATVLGGALLVLGLSINNRRVAEQIRRNDIAERGQFNTRFKDAATLLGSEHVSTILSGVYALHQIAEETYEEDQRQQGYINIVHDILSAYIRENTATIENKEKGKMWRINEKPTIIIQTIMKVLFKNQRSIYKNIITDLSDCVFENIDLDEANIAGVDFSRTKFIKSSFKNVTFESCYLEETFIDEIDFSNSCFKQTIFDLSLIKNTKFIKTKIIDSDFWDVTFNSVDFSNSHLQKVDFKNANFEEPISFANTILQDYSFDEITTRIK